MKVSREDKKKRVIINIGEVEPRNHKKGEEKKGIEEMVPRISTAKSRLGHKAKTREEDPTAKRSRGESQTWVKKKKGQGGKCRNFG